MNHSSKPPGPRLLVIADDLTGASDAGVQVALNGIRSLVCTDGTLNSLPTEYPVVVINSESRHLSAPEAAARVRRIARLGLSAGVEFFYKKTDSTLRGNIGAELEALLEVTGASCIPFVPALPELGRTTSDGIHYVHNQPIAESAFGRDPLNPVRASRVAEVLAPQISGAVNSAKAESPPAESFRGIAVYDCEAEADLIAIARALAASGHLRVVSGAVALLKHALKHWKISSPKPRLPEPDLPILLVNGSVNERALEQIAFETNAFTRVRLAPEQLIGGRANLTIPSGGNVLLYSIERPEEIGDFLRFGSAHGLSEKELHLRVAERMGQIVHEILAAGVFRTLVVFGGDTLAGIARAQRWRAFESLAEMEPGISITSPVESDLILISKAGGFGDASVVKRILGFVEANRRQKAAQQQQK